VFHAKLIVSSNKTNAGTAVSAVHTVQFIDVPPEQIIIYKSNIARAVVTLLLNKHISIYFVAHHDRTCVKDKNYQQSTP
jgi:hypothetical protein